MRSFLAEAWPRFCADTQPCLGRASTLQAALRVAELETTRTSLQQANDHLSLLASRHSREQADAESDRIRLEDELEGKIELVGRLRERVSALEKDKREVDRRYGEQTKSFEAERQALYDNEQVRSIC